MKSKPIVINAPTPAPSPSDVRAASFNEDQTPPENSFLGKYYRPNRNVRTQSPAPVASGGGGSTPKAPVVTQVQQESSSDRAGNRGANIYNSGSQTPSVSPTRVTDANAPPPNSAGKTSMSTSISAPSQSTAKRPTATVSPTFVSWEGSSARDSSNTGKTAVSTSKSGANQSISKSGGNDKGKKK